MSQTPMLKLATVIVATLGYSVVNAVNIAPSWGESINNSGNNSPISNHDATPIKPLQLAQNSPAQNPLAQNPPILVSQLMVVNSGGDDWLDISQALGGLDYEPIPLNQLANLNLNNVSAETTLFVPNAAYLSLAQVETLRLFVQNGGRLVITGAAGSKSDLVTQNALSTLVGGQWQEFLPQAFPLQTIVQPSSEWLDRLGVGSYTIPQGGVLKATDPATVVLAQWTLRDAAILQKGNVFFLGWQWGLTNERRNLDRNIILALASRNPRSRRPSNPNIATAIPSNNNSVSNAVTNNSSNNSSNNSNVNSNTNSNINSNGINSNGINSTNNFTNSNIPNSTNGNVPSVANENSIAAVPTANNRPIYNLEAIMMRQELEEVIGRVESALTNSNLNSSSGNGNASSETQAKIEQSKAFLQSFPQLVATGQFAEARRGWEQIRQNLWKDYPADLLTGMPEVRAVWLDRGSIVAANTEAKMVELFDRLAASGTNVVFVETVNAGYPIYPSQVAPAQNPLIRPGFDPLEAAVRLGRARKMEIHAWVWVFGVGNQRHNLLVGKPADYIGPVLSQYPQWANRHQEGALFAPEGKTFLDPANSEAQNYLLRLYREIVTKYDVDGLHLDYIRYPRQEVDRNEDFGFGNAGREKFRQITGIDPVNIRRDNASLWWLWTNFRAQQVNQFVGRVSQEMRSIKPSLTLSAAVFPWENRDRINRIQQSWETWISRGDLDLLVPMTYRPDTTQFLRQSVQPALNSVGNAPVLFLPGIGLYRLSGQQELVDQMQAVRDLPSGGYVLFAAEHLRANYVNLLGKSGQVPSANILPHRQPFTAANNRYLALRQEWRNLLESKRLWIPVDQLNAWEQSATRVEQMLNALDRSPSPAQAEATLAALSQLTNNLPEWTRLERLRRPYRINTWVNRLEAIAAMVRYGNHHRFAQTAK